MGIASERVKRIIRALQEKTEDRGCSEEEALAAAKKVGELLSEHDLEMDDIGVRAESADASKQIMRAADDFAGSICVGIASLCDLVVWKSGHGEFSFFGTEHDLALGCYLYEVCAEAMDIDWAKYMEVHGYSMKKRASFRMGFAGRITERLREIKAERKAAQMKMSSATDLVVLKDQLVKAEFNKLGIKLHKGAKKTIADMNAYTHGRAAGDRLNLNNPIGDGTHRGAQLG